MKCPACHSENPDASRFCVNCGKKLGPPETPLQESRTETLDASPETLERGSLLAGRYEVIEALGSGGMGQIYRVEDKKIKQEVALKLIRPEIAANKKMIERFRDELKTARMISHRNVCRMFDLGEERGTYFITMEYVAGEDLKSFLRRSKQLALGTTISIMRQICEGLAEAHRLGVVHRDLKAGNIMIDKEGNARIMDFGIALTPETRRVTDMGRVVGTPEAMSPEQAAGGLIDRRSDIYSLGIVFFQMVTGELPFKGTAPLAVAIKHKTEPAPNPRTLNRQVPESLSRLILKCLEKDPALRFQDVRDIIPELDRISQEHGITGGVEGEPATARGSSTITQLFGVLRKKISIPAFTVVSAVILAVCVFLVLLFVLRPKPVPGPGPVWKTSIAALPIRTPPDMEGFRESLTGDIISELSGMLPDVKVTPSHTMWLYKDTGKPLKQIGDELKAEYILEFNLHRAGESFVVMAELSKANENAIRDSWKEEYAVISQIQEKLPISIAHRLKLSLSAAGERAIPQDAYLAYLNGWNAEKQYRKSWDAKDFVKALDYYQSALAAYPDYAKAYVGIGNIYQGRFFAQEKRDRNDFESMRRAYQKAFDADPRLPEANDGLAWTFFFKEDLTNAYKFYQQALKLAPNNSEVFFDIASFLRDIGLFDQAIPLFEKACEIDPVWVEYVDQLAQCRMYKGDLEGAMKDVDLGLSKEPTNEELQLLRARLLVMTGKADEAAAGVDTVAKANPDNSGIIGIRAMLFAVQGKKKETLSLLRGRDPVVYTHSLSSAYAVLGMKDEAIANIDEVINHGFEKLGTYAYTYVYLKECPFFKSLRDDPRFQSIIQNAEREYQKNLRLYGQGEALGATTAIPLEGVDK